MTFKRFSPSFACILSCLASLVHTLLLHNHERNVLFTLGALFLWNTFIPSPHPECEITASQPNLCLCPQAWSTLRWAILTNLYIQPHNLHFIHFKSSNTFLLYVFRGKTVDQLVELYTFNSRRHAVILQTDSTHYPNRLVSCYVTRTFKCFFCDCDYHHSHPTNPWLSHPSFSVFLCLTNHTAGSCRAGHGKSIREKSIFEHQYTALNRQTQTLMPEMTVVGNRLSGLCISL